MLFRFPDNRNRAFLLLQVKLIDIPGHWKLENKWLEQSLTHVVCGEMSIHAPCHAKVDFLQKSCTNIPFEICFNFTCSLHLQSFLLILVFGNQRAVPLVCNPTSPKMLIWASPDSHCTTLTIRPFAKRMMNKKVS